MAQTPRSSALLRLSKRYTIIAVAAWTIAGAVIAGVWKVYEFQTEQARLLSESLAKQAEVIAERDEARSQAALTRRIEAQKPFLQKKLDLFFETIQQAQRLTEWELDPKDETWKQATKRFWELRWGELEMVGDAGVRNAARLVGQQITETEEFPSRDRHDLRWAVECLADELRFAIEHAWGIDRNATRESVLRGEGATGKLPNGCVAGNRDPIRPAGMQPLKAKGNLHQVRSPQTE
ncbi:hypothetical protein I6F21_08640 [Bradyrhizobium sp. NBAIM03]|nr:hypothetical protein [Bradyrhizobium sp. IC3123]MCA1423933.1 hypothetical protein [Bradyrhizobium sp. BRP23]MCA1532617.1 hypothetical protein [Bradyrhizobium sp. NBAIM03]